MGVGGHVVDELALHQAARKAAHLPAEAPHQRAGRDRREHARFDQRVQQLGFAVHGRAALRVGQQHAMSRALQPHDDSIQSGHDRREGRLEQYPRSVPKPQSLELIGVDLLDLGHRDLRARLDFQFDRLGAQALVQLAHQSSDRGRVVVVVPVHVGRCHHYPRPAVGRHTGKLQRALDRRGPVVDPGQHVGVKVDHRA